MSKTTSQQNTSTPQVPPELAERLIAGEITPAEFLGLTQQSLYGIATVGYEMLKTGRFQHALDIFQGLVAASPYDSVFHTNLAATYAGLERYDEAKASYTDALRYNIANVDALVGRSELYLRENKIPEALQDLQAALKLDPEAQRDTTKRARVTLMVLKKMADEASAAKP